MANGETRPDLGQITVVVLAGGLGTRLRSVVAERPKVLADVAGRPFMAYVLDQLEAQGFRRAVLCVGYMGALVEKELGTRHGNLQLAYSYEKELLGTAGAVRLALPSIDSSEIVMLNGDSFVKADFTQFVGRFRQKSSRAALLLTEVPDCARYGHVSVDEDERVLKFEEKGAHTGMGYINSGVYALQRDVLATVPTDRPVSIEREVFPRLIGDRFHGFKMPGQFLDIGIPEDYAKAPSFVAKLAKDSV